MSCQADNILRARSTKYCMSITGTDMQGLLRHWHQNFYIYYIFLWTIISGIQMHEYNEHTFLIFETDKPSSVRNFIAASSSKHWYFISKPLLSLQVLSARRIGPKVFYNAQLVQIGIRTTLLRIVYLNFHYHIPILSSQKTI